jgi:hypothetical protein
MVARVRMLIRHLPLLVCTLLSLFCVRSALRAERYRIRAEKAEKTTKALSRLDRPSEEEHKYLTALAERYGFVWNGESPFKTAVSLAAQMNLELNRTRFAESEALSPFLSLSTRRIPEAHTSGFDLSNPKIKLSQTPDRYQYSLFNPGPKSVAMPLLHSGIRWDTAEALVASLGWRSIENEVDRAIAIWKFVTLHRYHANPPTEGSDEHDIIRFFTCYGYGFCDDASQAVAGLAKLSGLNARIWGLDGHVVPEIFAGGRWIMLDADFGAYFHKPENPGFIMGVDELSKSRESFKHVVETGDKGPYDGTYAELFLTTENNKPWTFRSRWEHQISATLSPRQRVVFSNFNWGKHFIGICPNPPEKYFNGYFERPIGEKDFRLEAGLEMRGEGEGFILSNRSGQERRAEIVITWPFPIVGGTIESSRPVHLEFEDTHARRKLTLKPGKSISLDGVVSRVSDQPTTEFTLRLALPAGQELKFEGPLTLTCDFQFAAISLLQLKEGETEFRVHSEDPDSITRLIGEVIWK